MHWLPMDRRPSPKQFRALRLIYTRGSGMNLEAFLVSMGRGGKPAVIRPAAAGGDDGVGAGRERGAEQEFEIAELVP